MTDETMIDRREMIKYLHGLSGPTPELLNIIVKVESYIETKKSRNLAKIPRIFNAVTQLIEDNHAALVMLENDGLGDSPVAGFIRASLRRAKAVKP